MLFYGIDFLPGILASNGINMLVNDLFRGLSGSLDKTQQNARGNDGFW